MSSCSRSGVRVSSVPTTDVSGRLRAVHDPEREDTMFAFFSDRLGCLGSILVSVLLTGILLLVLRLL